MNEIVKKIANYICLIFGQYQVFFIPLIFFIIATVLYNIDVMISPYATGILGYASIFIYGGILIYTVVKIVFAWKNQIKEMKNDKNNNKQK